MNRGFRTLGLHAGQDPDPATGARAPPLYQTTSYVFDDADTAADRYALNDDGTSTRGSTTHVRFKRIARRNAVAPSQRGPGWLHSTPGRSSSQPTATTS